MDDFADSPQTIAELRALRDGDGSKWSPRDCLLHMLRNIDNGQLKPQELVIVFTQRAKIDPEDPNLSETDWCAASSRVHTTLGILARAMHLINIGCGDD